jgi:Sec-independent protein translocase protein TatA
MRTKHWGGLVVTVVTLLLGAANVTEAAENLAHGVYTFRDSETHTFKGNNICRVSVENQGPGSVQVRVVMHEKKSERTVFETVVGQGQSFTRTSGLGKWPWPDYTATVTAKGSTTAFVEIKTE